MRRQELPRILTAITGGFMMLTIGSSLLSPARVQAQANGKALFEKRCGGCHALDRDKEGPRLGGVYGRTAASIDGFQYSDALKKAKIIWKEDTLDRWLTDTEKHGPGNAMQ